MFTRRSIQAILDEWKPDIVHAHLRRATRLLANCNTSAAKVSTLHIGVNGPHFLNMDALIAISPWQLDQVPKSFGGRVQWIRNSLVPHPRPSANKIRELRNEFGCNESTFVIGGVGRLSQSKGWDILIEAFKKAGLENAILVLVGDGSEAKNLKKLAGQAPTIQFLGFKHNIKDYYAAFDVFVCPSREEPMGRVILEAMDAGVDVSLHI
ncbi:Glycosyltransferase [Alteromonadaceae bacterium Bs31]|nr:Glycosyltransferase [Alteromonadaceae bacterium Bs31]